MIIAQRIFNPLLSLFHSISVGCAASVGAATAPSPPFHALHSPPKGRRPFLRRCEGQRGIFAGGSAGKTAAMGQKTLALRDIVGQRFGGGRNSEKMAKMKLKFDGN